MKQTLPFLLIPLVAIQVGSIYAETQPLRDSSSIKSTSAQLQTSPASSSRNVSDAKSKPEAFSSIFSVIEKESKDESTWVSARARCELLLKQKLSLKDKREVQKQLEALNVRILLSPIPSDDSSFYTIRPGDSLSVIAKRNHTTVELIKQTNRLKSDTIQEGKKLKIPKMKFSIVVDKAKNKLELLGDGKRFKTYRVCTGKENSTPVGTFTIENKIKEPTWYKDGIKIPYGDKRNILGTRWLGFSLEHYGIHGTSLPETIGTQASAGCVRMLNEDVEELYDIVPLKTTVVVN